MKVLISGSSGYLGGRLTEHLARVGGYELRLGSRNPSVQVSGAQAIAMSWSDAASLDVACDGIETVVHLAGMNAVDSAADPESALRVNGLNTGSLVKAAERKGVRRFLHVSTAHVYGPLSGRITESTCPTALHPYATSHRAGEDAVRWANSIGPIEGLTIRLSNAFGPPARVDSDCWTLLINDLCRQAVVGRSLTLRSPGTQRRDFIPMTDACAAIDHLLRVPSLEADLLNVGSGWSPTVLEASSLVADRCEAVLGFRPPIAHPPSPTDSQDLPFDFSSEALRSTGFSATTRPADEIDRLLHFCDRSFSPA